MSPRACLLNRGLAKLERLRRRVVAPGGPLLLVVPHLGLHPSTTAGRSTPLAHLIEDDRAGVGEDDLTHLEEVVARRDLRRDVFAGDRHAFARRFRDNERHRGMHHHVFTTRSAVELVEHAGLEIEAVTARRPHHVIILARAT